MTTDVEKEKSEASVVSSLRDVSQEDTEGDLKAWLCVLGGWMVCFCTFGCSSAFGVYQDYYTLAGTASASSISWIGSIQLCLGFMLGIVSGLLFDKGYFRHLQLGGGFLYVFCLFMLSLADTKKYYQLFLSQGVGMGIGEGLMLVPALSVQAHHWKKRRAMAMGLVFTGSSCGGIVYPIMLNQLFYGKVGFAWGVRAAAFLTLGCLVIANLTMSTRAPPNSGEGGEAADTKVDLKGILTDPPFVVACAGTWLVLLALFFPNFYLQLFATLHGISPSLAFYTLAILNAGSILGRTVPNLLADKYGQFNVLVPMAAISGALIFAMFGASSAGGCIVFSLLYGVFSGGFISLVPPTIIVLSKNMNEVGARMGIGYFVTSFALLAGTPIAGALLGSNTHWTPPIVFSGAITLVGAALLALSRHLYARRKGSQHV